MITIHRQPAAVLVINAEDQKIHMAALQVAKREVEANIAGTSDPDRRAELHNTLGALSALMGAIWND